MERQVLNVKIGSLEVVDLQMMREEVRPAWESDEERIILAQAD